MAGFMDTPLNRPNIQAGSHRLRFPQRTRPGRFSGNPAGRTAMVSTVAVMSKNGLPTFPRGAPRLPLHGLQIFKPTLLPGEMPGTAQLCSLLRRLTWLFFPVPRDLKIGCFTEVPQYAPSDVIIKTKMIECDRVVGWRHTMCAAGRSWEGRV
jgi:hypothetical protein